MSIHQSVLDGSWSTARHLELRRWKKGSAAGPAYSPSSQETCAAGGARGAGEAWTWQSGGKSKGGRRTRRYMDRSTQQQQQQRKGQEGATKEKEKGRTWGSTEKETEGKPKERIPEK